MMNSPEEPFISVIIPVYNSSNSLRNCLKALSQQTYPASKYEVIVVDNASDEDIKEVVKNFQFVHLVREETVGSYAARNRGIKVALGEFLAFTDADCIPHQNWLTTGMDSLSKTEDIGLIAGHLEFTFHEADRPNALEFYDSVVFLNQRLYIEKIHFAATANLFTRKTVMESVGYFNSSLKSSGDVEWGQRVFSAGYRQLYEPKAIVYHPARSSFRSIYKKVLRVSGGQADCNRDREKSWLQFSKEMLIMLKPPKSWLLWKMSDPRLTRITKYQFILLRMMMDWLQVWERTRIKLGGNSVRG